MCKSILVVMRGRILIMMSLSAVLVAGIGASLAEAQTVPEWVKNIALWYGEGSISESEFITAIEFLIDQGILVVENNVEPAVLNATIIIPNGNSDTSSSGFYLPLNLEISTGASVTWVNDDSVPHNIQSQDELGNVTDMFNSPPMNTGDRFEHIFEEEGVYSYFCSFHPWRVGLVTVR